MKERANTVAAFVPGYVEDFEDLEDFEPEGVTHINPQKEAARREEELSELAEAERRGKEQEEAELKAKEEAELKEKEEKELKSKEEAKRKLKERKEEEQRAREKEEAAPRRERHEHESDIRGKEDESQTVAETQCASEKPTLPAVSASSTRVREMEQLQVTIHGAKNLPKKGMRASATPTWCSSLRINGSDPPRSAKASIQDGISPQSSTLSQTLPNSWRFVSLTRQLMATI